MGSVPSVRLPGHNSEGSPICTYDNTVLQDNDDGTLTCPKCGEIFTSEEIAT